VTERGRRSQGWTQGPRPIAQGKATALLAWYAFLPQAPPRRGGAAVRSIHSRAGWALFIFVRRKGMGTEVLGKWRIKLGRASARITVPLMVPLSPGVIRARKRSTQKGLGGVDQGTFPLGGFRSTPARRPSCFRRASYASNGGGVKGKTSSHGGLPVLGKRANPFPRERMGGEPNRKRSPREISEGDVSQACGVRTMGGGKPKTHHGLGRGPPPRNLERSGFERGRGKGP